MGRSTYANIGNVGPITAVVDGTPTGKGEIAYLIMLIARGLKAVDKSVIHTAQQLLTGLNHPTLAAHVEKRGALLIGKTIG